MKVIARHFCKPLRDERISHAPCEALSRRPKFQSIEIKTRQCTKPYYVQNHTIWRSRWTSAPRSMSKNSQYRRRSIRRPGIPVLKRHRHGLVRVKHRRIGLDAHDDALGAVAAVVVYGDRDTAAPLQQAGEGGALLADWMRSQTDAGSLRSGQIKEDELTDQSQRFLSEFAKALKSGQVDDITGPAWIGGAAPCVGRLSELSCLFWLARLAHWPTERPPRAPLKRPSVGLVSTSAQTEGTAGVVRPRT